MTSEEMIEMAKGEISRTILEAGTLEDWRILEARIKLMLRAACAAEREACARVVESASESLLRDGPFAKLVDAIAAAIRARP